MSVSLQFTKPRPTQVLSFPSTVLRETRWNSDLAVRTAYVPWEPVSEYEWKSAIKQLSNAILQFTENAYSKEFLKCQMALMVFNANRMEGTISDTHKRGPTLQKIVHYFKDDTEQITEPEKIKWNAEGGRDNDLKSTERQLFQYAQALEFLIMESLHKPLTEEIIKQVHKIMMDGSYDIQRGEKEIVNAGKLREQNVYAGIHQFIPPSVVKSALANLAARYNTYSVDNSLHPISLATFLFYELITIHPFTNGNGRLCRLMLVWSLMRDGFPFPFCFTSDHKSRRQHYMHAINRARKPVEGHRGELNVICIISLQAVMGNYLTNNNIIQTVS